jgi:hypothetical protein
MEVYAAALSHCDSEMGRIKNVVIDIAPETLSAQDDAKVKEGQAAIAAARQGTPEGARRSPPWRTPRAAHSNVSLVLSRLALSSREGCS